MFIGVPLCALTGVLVAMGSGSVAAGARTEIAAGEAPAPEQLGSEPTLISDTQLAVGARWDSRRSATTLRYFPRLLYRTNTTQGRPLVLHQLSAVHATQPTRRMSLQFDVDGALGEVEQGVLSSDVLGNSNVGYDIYSVYDVNGVAAWRYRATATSDVAVSVEGGYRGPTSISALPGVDVGDDNTTPENGQVSLTGAYQQSLTRRLRIVFPVRLSYYWSEVVGGVAEIGGRGGVAYSLSKQTDITVLAGLTLVRLPEESLLDVNYFPSGRLEIISRIPARRGDQWVIQGSAEHLGSFDSIRGDYRPLVVLEGDASYSHADWTVSAAIGVSTIVAENLYPGDARTVFRATLPLSYRISNGLNLAVGCRGSARSVEWPFGPLNPEQVEVLGFAAVAGVFGSRSDSRWVL